ncbi:hypothetical protein LTR91_023301 [Friedmanniomyces endolithicus]|uniref:CWH43-like N-terminal domain-containing protein n=1 Tax=Friedmanniomyces endolithicus TaxID=329885 RepID=A0A4U0UJS1_9PEZI|nr:hypothetical protein LTS09_001044 [Friedmanniomyces endolithicus]KAK0363160.1 hypothetical protein LTR94_016452 [Friedmanniomyces endolithicus]KAK0776057.1 hypothetical protein LTR59_014324 [Friedmanniomyces endolithicus]KAK0781319.1 hypothetical protein LTR38_013800 [Friedmanniomyces endolithicus]KAK0805741.1 hypothetical protein LTR75_007203 [Friedmanniomyces endolithicus]
MFGISYWFLPLFAGFVWLGTLLAMLGTWLAKGSPHYAWQGVGQHVTYISDVGATRWGRPLFITGSAVMVVVFDLAFISERWLRHKGRLSHNYSTTEKAMSICAIIFAIIGAAGLIFLTIFDTKDYPTVHDSMLGVFILGYIISAIFICAEYQLLGKHFREYRILRTSFWIKLSFIFVELGLAIGFAVTEYTGRLNISGYLEWIVSLVYIFYVWSFIIDFIPAVHTKPQHKRFPPVRRDDDEMAMNTQAQGSVTGGPVYSSGGYGHGQANQSEVDSYGSQQPMAGRENLYNPPQQGVVAPVYNVGGYGQGRGNQAELDNYGSRQPMGGREELYNPPQQGVVAPSRNF